ncbi:hypothetical protein ADL04_01245 [Streptomyces sp. NRRL B-3648]|nr:hypothetical protein ADL04_01245 [Streptomyces sp. NRRL B-3648]
MTAADVEVGLSAAWYGPQGPLISNDEVAEFVAESEGRLRGVAGAGLTRPIQAVRELRMGRERTRVRGPADGALVVAAPAHRPALLALVFHHMVKEAEAFAAGLPDVGAQLHAADPELYPRTIWADRLCGEHEPNHRRWVLGEFASGIATDGTVVEKGFLGSVKVPGKGVDTKNCDSVCWADVRGSMPDLVQAVGRALRMQPGEGKVASLVVPVLFGPGETADNMLPSRTVGGLAKLLEGLRAQTPGGRAARRAAGPQRLQARPEVRTGPGEPR